MLVNFQCQCQDDESAIQATKEEAHDLRSTLTSSNFSLVREKFPQHRNSVSSDQKISPQFLSARKQKNVFQTP